MKILVTGGLGFVGSAMAAATSIARDRDENLLYDVTGIDLDNKIGKERVNAINQGKFPSSFNEST